MPKRKSPNIAETWRKVQETHARLERTVKSIESEVERAERVADSVHGKAGVTRKRVQRTERLTGVNPGRGGK